MSQPAYPIRTTVNRLQFVFESVNQERIIHKQIEFTPFLINPDIYNLAFGDLTQQGELNDLLVSNNQDMERVLATVVQAVLFFLETYPDKTVFFTGSTAARTRLYRAAVGRVITGYEQIQVDGIIGDIRESFLPNRPYEVFLVKRIR